MKELKFEAYQPKESTLEDYGTVKEQVGKNGTIGLVEDNFNDPNKRVVIILKRADGTSKSVSCSKRTSDALRSRKITLANVLAMSIMVGETGVPFISSQGGRVQEFSVDKINSTKASTKTAFLSEAQVNELLALA